MADIGVMVGGALTHAGCRFGALAPGWWAWLALAALSAAATVLWRLGPVMLSKVAPRQPEPPQCDLDRTLGLAEQIAHVGHWRVSLPDYAITWSDEVYRIHGLDKLRHVPTIENAVAAYHPDDVPMVRETLGRTEATREEFEFTARLIRPDGEIRHVVSRGIPQTDRHGVVTAIFGVFLDLTDQKRIEASLQRANSALSALALEDCLTGLANRRRFDAALEAEVRRAGRNARPIALIMLDVDHFMAYNDLYGHPAGDDCLRAVGGVLAGLTHRAGDLAARCGGEEFAVLMPDTDETGAACVAERIVAAVRALERAHCGSAGGFVTISAGVAALIPLPGRDTPHELCQAADAALYRSKAAGRGRVARHGMQAGFSSPPPPRVPEWTWPPACR